MNSHHSPGRQARSVHHIFRCALATLMLALFSAAALAEKVNLNTADAEALQYIPGIGPGKSLDIIRAREEQGGFKAMDDLLAVPGIGEKTLIEIRKHGSLESGVSTLTEEMKQNPPKGEASTTSSTFKDSPESSPPENSPGTLKG